MTATSRWSCWSGWRQHTLTLIIKGVRQLVTHHHPDAAEVQRPADTNVVTMVDKTKGEELRACFSR